MSKWECRVCGIDEPCILHMVNDEEGSRPVCCPVDNTSGIKPEWHPVDETATNCNQFPKLTTEVFNRPDCPEWAKYAAVSKFGCLTFFEEKPVLGNNSFLPLDKNYTTKLYRNEPGRWDASDWQNSLIERPAKLPDWCKVGEWVYIHKIRAYVRVAKTEGYLLFNNAGHHVPYDDCKQARLRPYNAEEMRALMGKVIKKGPSMHIVTGFENVFCNECMVHVNGCLYSANDLLRQFHIGNAPCGVLEHLENGEWVK